MFDQKTKDKFWGYVEKSPDPEACHIWRGSTLRGYGKFHTGGAGRTLPTASPGCLNMGRSHRKKIFTTDAKIKVV